MRYLSFFLSLLTLSLVSNETLAQHPTSKRAESAIQRVTPRLKAALEKQGLSWGSPVFMRIFKESEELEVWVQAGEVFKHFKTYEICNFSGHLGPKLKTGDHQSPEGFYSVAARQLNPHSRFHLSFNLGYPNAYDRARQRTGDALMVHGNCVSIGCYAMTDNYIEEIYALADAALRNGQPSFQVHAFPFRLTDATLARHKASQWFSFWQNLQEGYDYFEKHKTPPKVTVNKKRYVFLPQ
jgi:murein L,D-transpeptidase YafK